jgi:putative phosphoesterase
MQGKRRDRMIAGIISDSHHKSNYLKEAAEFMKTKIDFLIHAGDIGSIENLEIIEKLEVPYIAVFGNNDSCLFAFRDRYNLVDEPYYFNLSNKKIKLMHHPYYFSVDADIIIYGHTHKFNIEKIGKSFFICPGEICGKKFAKIEGVLWDLEREKGLHFYKNYYEKEWQKESV